MRLVRKLRSSKRIDFSQTQLRVGRNSIPSVALSSFSFSTHSMGDDSDISKHFLIEQKKKRVVIKCVVENCV